MPITSNNTAIMNQRQSFNGKGLTFIEVIFDDAITGSATTPETKDSNFQKVRDAVLNGGPLAGNGGTLLGQSFALARKATDDDASEVAAINADDSIDTYQFIMEGTPAQLELKDGSENLDPNAEATSDAGIIAAVEADLEAEILSRLSISDSAGNVNVKIRVLPAEGVKSTTHATDNAVFGMFDQRGAA
jgi:hypothetical protein